MCTYFVYMYINICYIIKPICFVLFFFAGGFNIVSSEFFADVLNQHIKKTFLAEIKMDQRVNKQQITNKTLKTINKHNRFQWNGSSLKICSQKFERAKQQVQQFVLCHYILIVNYVWRFLFHKIRDKSAILTQCSKNSSCISSGCLIFFFTLLAKNATRSQLHSLQWTPPKKNSSSNRQYGVTLEEDTSRVLPGGPLLVVIGVIGAPKSKVK